MPRFQLDDAPTGRFQIEDEAPAAAEPSMGAGERAVEDITNVGTGLTSGVIGPARAGHAIGEKLSGGAVKEAALNLIPGVAPLRAATQLQDLAMGKSEGLRKLVKGVTDIADRPSKTPEGRYIKSVAEQVPGTLLGGGAPAYKAASALGAGLGGQGAADLTGNDPLARALGTIAGGIGGSFAAGKLVPGLSTTRALTPQEQSDVELMDKGYKLTPSQANPSELNRFLEGIGGKYRTAQELSVVNQDVTDALARQEFGLPPDAPLTKETLEAVRKSAGKAYDAIERIPQQMRADNTFVDDLAALTKRADEINAQAPGTIDTADIQKLQDSLLQPEFSPGVVMKLVRRLRADASTLSRDYGNVAAQDEYIAKRAAADALEGLVERNLQELQYPDLLAGFRQARTVIAKTHDLEEALTPNWNVSEKALHKVGETKPLSGNLKTIATMGGRYPKATQEVSSFGGTPTIGPLETAMAISSGHPQAIGGLPLVGGLTRALQRSRPYQEAFVRPTGRETIPDQQLLERLLASPGVLGILNSNGNSSPPSQEN